MSTPAAEAWALAFGDLSFEDGVALREGTAWRHLPASDPGRYGALLSVADLDAFLRTEPARAPRVSMADGGRQGSASVPEEEYATPDGRVDLPRLFARFDAGATLVVSQFHEVHAPLAHFCRGLERAFLHAVQANIYLTPPGAQGFRVHYDTHDVLVLQVQGRKQWRIWDAPVLDRPTRRTPFDRAAHVPAGEPQALELGPGDALWVPRGVAHDAVTQDDGEASLHVTLGFLEPSWAEALRAAIDRLEIEDAAFRASLPTWRLGGAEGASALAATAAALAARLGAEGQADHLAVWALDKLAQDRLDLPGRGLLTPPPEPTDRMRLSALMHHHLVPFGDGAALRWSAGVERLSPEELGWLERLEDGASAAELGGEALGFVRRLAAAGLLEPA